MMILLAIFNSLLDPYWDIYKKYLSKKGFASMTVICSPNLVEHSIGIIVLLSLGLFVLPTEPYFYFYWFLMVIISALELTLNIWGLVKSSFFGVHVVGSLTFVVSSIAAVLFIGEHLSYIQYLAIVIAFIGVVLFTWPKDKNLSFKNIDRGIIFVFVSVILSGLSLIPYKMATLYTPDFSTFLTGRIVADLVSWNLVWLISLLWMRRSPTLTRMDCRMWSNTFMEPTTRIGTLTATASLMALRSIKEPIPSTECRSGRELSARRKRPVPQ